MERFVVNIDDDELNALLMEEKDFQYVLLDYFGNSDEAAIREGGDTVASWLAGLHEDEDGMKEVLDFSIGEVDFNIIDLKGDFKIFYTISYALQSDGAESGRVTKLDVKTIKYNFTLDVESKQIVCKTQLYPSSR